MATATATKTAPVTKAPKTGIRKPQYRILAALAKKSPMNRTQIAEKAGVDVAWLTSWIGSVDEGTRKANDTKNGFASLITLGLVKPQQSRLDESAPMEYVITAKGKTEAVNAPK